MITCIKIWNVFCLFMFNLHVAIGTHHIVKNAKGLHCPIVTHKAQKVTGPTYEAQLELIGPGRNLEELLMSVEDHLKTHKSVCQILQFLESAECLLLGLEASFIVSASSLDTSMV